MARRPRFSITAEHLPETRALMARLPTWYAGKARGVVEYQLAAFKTEMVARSTSGPVYRQTGRLAGSWYAKTEGETLATLSAYFASFADKSYLLEFGGTVYPKSGSLSWIFISTDLNRKVNGTAIRTPKQVTDSGGEFYTRRSRDDNPKYAVIQGKTSPAWNLLLDASGEPMFIQVKRAHYIPLLGFFDAGVKHEQRLVPRLADLVVDYWKAG